MKNILTCFAVVFSFCTFGQINNPGGTINTCTGVFNDDGGTGANYADGQNITTTLCSDAGNCITVDFTAFDVEDGWDFLQIFDGPTTASPSMGTFTGLTGPGTVTSTSGCLTFLFTSDGSFNNPGWTSNISCAACPAAPDYTHPTSGINGEKVGTCLVTDCGPFTYTDDGGNGNYSHNVAAGGVWSPQNSVYRIFCPDVAGNCMRATFTEFETSSDFDVLWVRNGPTEYSPNFTSAPTATTQWPSPPNFSAYDDGLFGNLNASTPFSFTSTDASGCLGFAFLSNGVNSASGWSATLECVPCVGGPNGTDNNDCQMLTAICSNVAIPGNSTGPGISAEGCTGTACPAGGENHTNWYKFQAFSTGTFEINLTPTIGTDDYDFAIYGPNVDCNALGSPIRCTDSGVQGSTGMTNTAGDNIEDVTGDSFLQTLNVVAGETYMLVVDEWSSSTGGGYTLSFGGTASLDCIVLPVELSQFDVEYAPDLDQVDIFWSTESERDNDYFMVERSLDGINFQDIARVESVGNTTNETKYLTPDLDPHVGMNYYRLRQVDLNGDVNYSDVKSVNILNDAYDIISVYPNPTKEATEIIFNAYNKSEATFKLFNTRGELMETKLVNCTPGGNRVSVDLSGHANGIYMFTLTTNNKSYSERIIKN